MAALPFACGGLLEDDIPAGAVLQKEQHIVNIRLTICVHIGIGNIDGNGGIHAVMQRQERIGESDEAVIVCIAGEPDRDGRLGVLADFTNAALAEFVGVDGFIAASAAMPPMALGTGEYMTIAGMLAHVEVIISVIEDGIHICGVAVGAGSGLSTIMPIIVALHISTLTAFGTSIPVVGVVMFRIIAVVDVMAVFCGHIVSAALDTMRGGGAIGKMVGGLANGLVAVAADLLMLCAADGYPCP